jgi:hypothetical protein
VHCETIPPPVPLGETKIGLSTDINECQKYVRRHCKMHRSSKKFPGVKDIKASSTVHLWLDAKWYCAFTTSSDFLQKPNQFILYEMFSTT